MVTYHQFLESSLHRANCDNFITVLETLLELRSIFTMLGEPEPLVTPLWELQPVIFHPRLKRGQHQWFRYGGGF